MKKIKLLLAAPTYYPFYGGAEMRFRRYLPLLQSHGIDSCVFTGTPKAKKITEAHKSEAWHGVNYGERLPDEIDQGINVIRYRLPEKPAKKRISVYHSMLRDYINQNFSDIDVIQFLSPFTQSSIETFKYARKKGIATVAACTLAKKPNPNLIKRVLYNLKLKKIYSATDCVVVSSEEMKNYLYCHDVKNRIEVIGNGVDTHIYSPVKDRNEKQEIREKLGININKKILLNVGSVHPRKGVDLLLKAFEIVVKQRDDIDLYIAGSRVDKIDKSLEAFHKEISELISNPSIKNRVHFLGLIENVNEYMKVADVFVFPSREEGMGNVVMEAMASGIPVVVTPYLGFPSVFGTADKNYSMAEFDEIAIANCISLVLHDQAYRENLIINASSNVSTKLSMNESIQQYADLYNKLATIS